MKEIIKNKIIEIIETLKVENKEWVDLDIAKINFTVENTREAKFGDVAVNVAMSLATQLKKNPIEIAQKIADALNNEKLSQIEKITVVAPGYINFYLSKEYFKNGIEKVIENNEKWGELEILKNQEYIFEHSSPNLFKPFHIGHLVNNSIGESLVRIIRCAGANVETLSFPSDISPGIAKTVWAIGKNKWEDKMTVEKIGEAYVIGSAQYKEDEKAKAEIDAINGTLYEKKESPELEIYKKGQALSLDYFKEITKSLGSHFDELIFESEAEVVGKEIVRDNIPGIFKESQGAIIFPGSKYGLYDNVFINSQGFGTYLTKDIGLLKIKFNKFKFNKSVTITDVEQREHFTMVKKAGELINKEWADKSEYLQHGRLSFAGEKISSRYGNVPLAEDLIDAVKGKILEKIKEQDFPQAEKEAIAQAVAIGALKYSILKCSAGKNIVFDFEKATAFEGDTGPYLQYAVVRTNSVLAGVQELDIDSETDLAERNGVVPQVEKMILNFPQAIAKSLEDNSPHHLANYLYKLAADFSSFYANTKILDTANPDFKNNLALTKAVQITLKNGLNLLGIETLERM